MANTDSIVDKHILIQIDDTKEHAIYKVSSMAKYDGETVTIVDYWFTDEISAKRKAIALAEVLDVEIRLHKSYIVHNRNL